MSGDETLTEEPGAKFWRDARERVKEANKQMDVEEPVDFSGGRFPPDPADEYFRGLPFRTPVSFASAEFACFNPFDGAEFGDEVDWMNCRLTGEDGRFLFARCWFASAADFRNCCFPDRVDFRGVTFEGEADFGGQGISVLRFDQDDQADSPAPCRFAGAARFDDCVLSDVDFSGVHFESDASFSKARFTFWPRFRETVFKGGANFAKAVFERLTSEQRGQMSQAEAKRNRADFSKAVFEYDVDFSGTKFHCDADFDDARFHRDAVFDGAEVHGTFGFRCHCADGSDIRVERLRIRREYDGDSAYRAAKNAAHLRGDSRAEGDYHYREQCAANARDRQDGRWLRWPLSRDSKVRAWASYVFGRWVYGYGEKPERVVLAGILVMVLWACLYCLLDAAGKGASSFGTYLYFSVVTFTTLGYGDLQPEPGLPRFLAGTEALLGAALMALFVVALTRKYTR